MITRCKYGCQCRTGFKGIEVTFARPHCYAHQSNMRGNLLTGALSSCEPSRYTRASIESLPNEWFHRVSSTSRVALVGTCRRKLAFRRKSFLFRRVVREETAGYCASQPMHYAATVWSSFFSFSPTPPPPAFSFSLYFSLFFYLFSPSLSRHLFSSRSFLFLRPFSTFTLFRRGSGCNAAELSVKCAQISPSRRRRDPRGVATPVWRHEWKRFMVKWIDYLVQ